MELRAQKGRGSPAALEFYPQGGPTEDLCGLSLGGPLGGRRRGHQGMGSGYRRMGAGVW